MFDRQGPRRNGFLLKISNSLPAVADIAKGVRQARERWHGIEVKSTDTTTTQPGLGDPGFATY